jgi:serine protease
MGVCYERLGGTSGKLGFPTSGSPLVGPSQHPTKTKGRYKNFEGGRIYWSRRTGAHPVWDAVADLYHGLGGAESRLGFPISHEMPADTSPQGTAGVLQRFEGGPHDAWPVGDEWDYSKGVSVYSSKHGAYPVWGGIGICYERLGNTSSVLGFPTSLETEAGKSPQGTTGWYQRFEGGIIFWCENYGGVPVVGSILALYDEFDGTEGRFGFPKSPEKSAEEHPHMLLQEFEGGVICVLH